MTTFGNIPTKNLKQSSKSFSDTLQKLFNNALRDDDFPDKLKCADETPVFLKIVKQKQRIIDQYVFYRESRKLLQDYCTSKQILTTNFCPLRDFCALTQHALLSLIENWKKELDNK